MLKPARFLTFFSPRECFPVSCPTSSFLLIHSAHARDRFILFSFFRLVCRIIESNNNATEYLVAKFIQGKKRLSNIVYTRNVTRPRKGRFLRTKSPYAWLYNYDKKRTTETKNVLYYTWMLFLSRECQAVNEFTRESAGRRPPRRSRILAARNYARNILRDSLKKNLVIEGYSFCVKNINF